MKISRLSVILVVLFAFLSSTFAQQGKDLEIKLTAEKVVKASDGKESVEKAERAKPGEVIQYTAVYSNKTQGALGNLEPSLPIPPGMEYIAGSAKPAPAKASLDGKTFQTLPIKRKVKTAEGAEVEQEVPASEYRILRWSVGQLAGGKNVSVSARAKIVSSRPVALK